MRNLATTALERVIGMNQFHEGYLSGQLGYFRFTYAPFFFFFFFIVSLKLCVQQRDTHANHT